MRPDGIERWPMRRVSEQKMMPRKEKANTRQVHLTGKRKKIKYADSGSLVGRRLGGAHQQMHITQIPTRLTDSRPDLGMGARPFARLAVR
jgi:hypothetical protein